MILRLGANAAVHAAGGVAMGVTLALAACTVARTAQRGACAPGQGRERGATAKPPVSGAADDAAGG